MIELVSKKENFLQTFIVDEERLWSRVMELADQLDKENEEGLEKKDFVWGDLYEDELIR